MRAEIALMSGSAFAVTHHAFSSGAGRTADGNGSHASTLKSPSYTKSVSWQHYLGTRNRLSIAISWVWNHSVRTGEPALSREPKLRSRVRRQPVLIQKGIRRVPLKLQRCPTWYHRAQLQQSVSGHTNAFFDELSDRAVRHTRYRHKRWPY